MPSAPRKAIRKSMRSADSYGNPAKKQGVARATYKPGGLYSTGRAIAMAPGTKARAKFRDSDTRLGKPTTKPATKPTANKTYSQSSKSYSVGKAPMKYRQTSAGKPKNYRRSQ